MDEALPAVHGVPIRYASGEALSVETLEGLVRLVTRDADGKIQSGILLAPSEAQQLASAILEAAFHA